MRSMIITKIYIHKRPFLEVGVVYTSTIWKRRTSHNYISSTFKD